MRKRCTRAECGRDWSLFGVDGCHCPSCGAELAFLLECDRCERALEDCEGNGGRDVDGEVVCPGCLDRSENPVPSRASVAFAGPGVAHR